MKTSIDDHRAQDGRVDWRAYREAQAENGESCQVCGAFAVKPSGKRFTCNKCKRLLASKNEMVHSDAVRCPACGGAEDGEPLYEAVEQEVVHRVEQDGEHVTLQVTCKHCGHQYEATREIAVRFVSPPRA